MAMKCGSAPVGEPFSYNALTNATLFARIGDHNLTETETSERDRLVQRIIIHPDYQLRSSSSENDIALLKLEKPVMPDLAIETIELLLQRKYDELDNSLGYAQVLQLLKSCLRTYFTFDGTVYEHVKGTPMGLPISGFIAEAVLRR
nr:unnamed protein product [Spirometra erinaceieuropaei]